MVQRGWEKGREAKDLNNCSLNFIRKKRKRNEKKFYMIYETVSSKIIYTLWTFEKEKIEKNGQKGTLLLRQLNT